ncbi:hypothetical protein [Streptomyces sp. NPDC054804]
MPNACPARGPDRTAGLTALLLDDRQVDLHAIRTLHAARCAGFRDAATAERPAHAVPGTVLPCSFDCALELLADLDVVAQPCLYLIAAALSRRFTLPAWSVRWLMRQNLARPGICRLICAVLTC